MKAKLIEIYFNNSKSFWICLDCFNWMQVVTRFEIPICKTMTKCLMWISLWHWTELSQFTASISVQRARVVLDTMRTLRPLLWGFFHFNLSSIAGFIRNHLPLKSETQQNILRIGWFIWDLLHYCQTGQLSWFHKRQLWSLFVYDGIQTRFCRT